MTKAEAVRRIKEARSLIEGVMSDRHTSRFDNGSLFEIAGYLRDVSDRVATEYLKVGPEGYSRLWWERRAPAHDEKGGAR